jgi:hypothetical protein
MGYARIILDGVFPDVAFHEGALWTIARAGDPRVSGTLDLYEGSMLRWMVPLPAGSPCFPKIHSYDQTLWIAYHDGIAGVLRNITTGRMQRLAPCENNHPIVLGFGWVAWQGAQAGGWLITRMRLDSGIQSIGGFGRGTGLSRVDPDGTVHLVDDDRLALPGATIPCWAGDLAVGEGRDGGAYWQLATGERGVLWRGMDSFTPRCAVDGQGRYAICTAGAPHGVRVWEGTRAELIATRTPVPPPPPPIDPPPPPPVEPEEPVVQIPPDVLAIARQMEAEFGNLNRGSDDDRRQWIKMTAEQVAYDIDPDWGVKNAGGGRPQGKDALAHRLGPEPDAFECWDLVDGNTRKVVANPEYHAREMLRGQQFMAVAPTNHLGTPAPPDPPPIEPPPVEPPAPPSDDAVLKLLSQVSRDVKALQQRFDAHFR